MNLLSFFGVPNVLWAYTHVQLSCTKTVSSKYNTGKKKKSKQNPIIVFDVTQVAELLQGRLMNRKALSSSIKMQRKSNISGCL